MGSSEKYDAGAFAENPEIDSSSNKGRFEASEKLNSDWPATDRGKRITVQSRGFIQPDTKFFAMGSCFAFEVRKALRQHGFVTFPDYHAIELDSDSQIAGRLPERDNINHYDTFVIRQEIERALSGGRWDEESFWHLQSGPVVRSKGWPDVFQDPHRRRVYGRTMGSLKDLSDRISARIDEGLAAADVVILTLGLTECWRIKSSGLYAAFGPHTRKDPVYPLVDLRLTNFLENYHNLCATLEAIWLRRPGMQIVLTVSPVPLQRTWTTEDVVCANMHSKATLRSVAGQVCRDYPRVIYWPSFEYALAGDVYMDDGRHVREDAVSEIVSSFLEMHTARP